MRILSEFIFQGCLYFLGDIVSLLQRNETIHAHMKFYRNTATDVSCPEVMRRTDFGVRKND